MMDSLEISGRVRRLRASMEEAGIGSLLVSGSKNVEYLTGRETGRLLVSRRGCFLWTRELYRDLYSGLYSDSRYPFDVRVFEKGIIKKEVRGQRIRKLFVEDVPHNAFIGLGRELGVKLGTTDLVERQRAVKTKHEISLLRKSCSIAVKGMKKARAAARQGVREQDAVAEAEYVIRKAGSDAPPFDQGMLLSSGPASADVHAKASARRMRAGTTVVVDLGARYQGYYSDMTRTIALGRIDRKAKDLLEFVENLKEEAIDLLRPGAVAGDVHSFIEKRIEARGYRLFHGSGHGVGLNIHELPSLSKDSMDVLEKDMVFTIEPGIYIPGRFGVRFEDTVLLGKNKAEVLTKTRW